MSMHPSSFGAELYRLRQCLGLTQAQVAGGAGLNRGYYSQLENSRAPPPPAKTLLRIATALKLEKIEQRELFSLAETERVRPGYRDGDLPEETDLLVILRGRARLNVSSDQVRRISAILDEET